MPTFKDEVLFDTDRLTGVWVSSERLDLVAVGQVWCRPSAVTTDKAPAYPRVLDELVPAACHITDQYGINLIEADHG